MNRQNSGGLVPVSVDDTGNCVVVWYHHRGTTMRWCSREGASVHRDAYSVETEAGRPRAPWLTEEECRNAATAIGARAVFVVRGKEYTGFASFEDAVVHVAAALELMFGDVPSMRIEIWVRDKSDRDLRTLRPIALGEIDGGARARLSDWQGRPDGAGSYTLCAIGEDYVAAARRALGIVNAGAADVHQIMVACSMEVARG